MATPQTTDAGRRSSGPARHITTVARILLGLVFVVTGLNGFVMFLPAPSSTSIPAEALAFQGALAKSGYMILLISATQAVAGALLLVKRFVALALVVLAPVVVNIVLFHIFLDPVRLPIAGVVVLLEVYLLWTCRRAYAPMLTARA